jgi:hypothetical protein
VDTLPEAALEAVERVLQRFQTWPLEMPRDAQNMQKRMKELIAARTARRGGTSGAICTGGGGHSTSGGGCWTSDGDGVAHAHGSKDGAEVAIELRRFRGHELQIERRLGVSEDKRKLLYALLIKGPDGKEGHREIEFDIAGDSPPPL